MARVRDINIEEVSEEIKPIYRDFLTNYGPFANQAKVFAHRPIIFKHIMSMLLEIAKNPIIEKSERMVIQKENCLRFFLFLCKLKSMNNKGNTM